MSLLILHEVTKMNLDTILPEIPNKQKIIWKQGFT
jgi:hypothetical protein